MPAGCGGGGGGSDTIPVPSFESVNDFTLQPTLKVLPQDGSVRISAVTADSVTLSGAAPPLAAGDALLSNETLPDGTFGLIRKVVSVSQNGADTLVQTQPGDLADVFQTAQIHERNDFPAAAYENLEPGTPGISFGQVRTQSAGGGRRGRDEVALFPLTITFRNVYLQAPDGTVIAELNGQVSVQAGMETQLPPAALSIPKGIRSMILAPYVSVDGNVTVRTRVKGNFVKKIPISDPLKPLEFTFAIGPVGLNAKMNLYAQVDGDFDGTGDVRIQGGVYLAAGLGCGEAIGKGENKFGPYRDSDHYFKMGTANIYPRATLQLNASVMQPEAQLSLAGLGSVFARLDALRGQGTFTYQSVPNVGNAFVYDFKGAFLGTVGGRLELLQLVSLFNGEITLINLQFPLGRSTLRDTGQNTPPPSLPGQSPAPAPGDIGITLR
jgi:hypothetical protein